MKYYDKMHYEEELDMFCGCIRANISIMLHKTIYEINSTLLLRTHFKPPSSVCNNFLLWSHVDFSRLLLLKYAIYSLFFIAVQMSISDVGYTFITYKNYIQTISYRNRVFIILIYSGCCKSLNMYALAETHIVCVTTASPFLSCQMYIPSILHISKRIYFHICLSTYTLVGHGTL